MNSSFVKNAIVLGLLSAIGPFAIDMYLPALPSIAADLHATTAATQMTLMAFFIAFGVCQLAFGPWADVYGRKRPLVAGVLLFIVGAIGCGLAPGIASLIAWRFVQGMGAASVMVIPRAIIRDLHTGPDATRLMALVMLVFSVSPILAPLVGSALIVPFGWRAVFVAVTLAALLSLALIGFVLPETCPPEARVKADARSVLAGFAHLMRDGRFLGLTFTGGLGMASFFVFLANSSFIYIDHFGLSTMQYGLTFAVNAIGFIGASQFAAPLGERFGMARVVMAAAAVYAAAALVLFVVTALGGATLPVLVALLFVTFAWLGLVIPTTMVLALDDHGPIAGIASALGGTLQMVTGGLMIVVASLVYDGTPLPMVTLIALLAVSTVTVAVATLGRSHQKVAAAETRTR